MSFVCRSRSMWNLQKVDVVKRRQRTLARSVSASGVGLFTGRPSQFSLIPAPAGHGIVFKRLDLPSCPLISAISSSVQATPRCTIIGQGDVHIQTIEHLLAVLKAYEIDNVLVEITAEEVPIFDGSSSRFVELIEAAGVQELQEEQEVLVLKEPVSISQGGAHLVALPAEHYKISYALHYPHCPAIGSQFYSFAVTQEGFKKEIASCRTFSIYEEIAPMIDKGLIKGGSLESAVLIKEGVVANPEGLRFKDEMVRHKILDLIGDLSLLPPFVAHVIAICSGHASNNAFAKQFLKHVKVECL